MKKFLAGAVAALLLLGSVTAWSQQVAPIPKVTSIGASDLFQDIVNGQPSAQNQYAPASLLGNYGATLAGNNPENLLIGGDSTTNLYQRATTGSSVTTTLTYGGPDRWAYWSGTSTAMTVSRTTTAADLPTLLTFRSGFKMARTSGQTGVVQVCMMQVVESANAYGLSGQTAEIDFHATAGATFSAGNSNLTVYLITGTGADEAASTAAFNLNAGGGGSSTWTGQVNTGVAVAISTVNSRYTVAIPAPSGTTEAAVAICFTPVGTAGANDYVALSGIQLTRNSALTSIAGTAGIALPANDNRAKSFARRSQQVEAALQQRYYFSVPESATSGAQQSASGNGATTTTCQLFVPFPVTMRIAPTFGAIGTALSASTWTITHIATATALSTPYLAVLGANTPNGGSLTATVASGLTTGQTCVLTSANGGSILGWTAEL